MAHVSEPRHSQSAVLARSADSDRNRQKPFVHLAPSISIDEKNDALAYGAEASLKMNLADADAAPERELNEILWRSIKGSQAVMPPAVRSAFVRRISGADGDDDDRR